MCTEPVNHMIGNCHFLFTSVSVNLDVTVNDRAMQSAYCRLAHIVSSLQFYGRLLTSHVAKLQIEKHLKQGCVYEIQETTDLIDHIYLLL